MTADQLRRAAKVLREHATNASPGPWFYDSYSAISSAAKVVPYDEWCDRMSETDGGAHTNGRYGHCVPCGDWKQPPLVPSPGLGHGCRHFREDYRLDPLVATVPPVAGDSAHGTRAHDAHLIALMDPIVALALADLLDATAAGMERSDWPGGRQIFAVARAILREGSDGA